MRAPSAFERTLITLAIERGKGRIPESALQAIVGHTCSTALSNHTHRMADEGWVSRETLRGKVWVTVLDAGREALKLKPPVKEGKFCRVCKEKFFPKTKTQTTCSKKCSKVNSPIAKTCIQCGVEFSTTSHNRKTCSAECVKERRYENAAGHRRKKLEPRQCCCCGEKFTPKYSNKMTCNKRCSSKHSKLKKTVRRRGYTLSPFHRGDYAQANAKSRSN